MSRMHTEDLRSIIASVQRRQTNSLEPVLPTHTLEIALLEIAQRTYMLQGSGIADDRRFEDISEHLRKP